MAFGSKSDLEILKDLLEKNRRTQKWKLNLEEGQKVNFSRANRTKVERVWWGFEGIHKYWNLIRLQLKRIHRDLS